MSTCKKLNVFSLVLVAACLFIAEPAKASINDSTTLSRFQIKKEQLLIKERNLLKDYDDLRKQLDELQRRNDGGLAHIESELAKLVEFKYADLKKVQFDIRDIELKML